MEVTLSTLEDVENSKAFHPVEFICDLASPLGEFVIATNSPDAIEYGAVIDKNKNKWARRIFFIIFNKKAGIEPKLTIKVLRRISIMLVASGNKGEASRSMCGATAKDASILQAGSLRTLFGLPLMSRTPM